MPRPPGRPRYTVDTKGPLAAETERGPRARPPPRPGGRADTTERVRYNIFPQRPEPAPRAQAAREPLPSADHRRDEALLLALEEHEVHEEDLIDTQGGARG